MIADFDWNTPKENTANALLCSKAPEMFEALKELYFQFEHNGQESDSDKIVLEKAQSLLNSIQGRG